MSIPKLITTKPTPKNWLKRRKELLTLLETYEYGVTPDLSFEDIQLSKLGCSALTATSAFEADKLTFIKDEFSFDLRFEIYASKASQSPVIVLIDVFDNLPSNLQKLKQVNDLDDVLPYQMITDLGLSIVVVHPNDICSDSVAAYDKGFLELAPKKTTNSWGAIGVWAWGTSRVIDFLVKDPRFDPEKIAVLGVSRAGKTALWCGAQDERIRVIIACVSGCGGASLLRKGSGEHIRDMTKNFPYWTCDNLATFAECEEALPIDQHMLLALCAPRPLYLSDAEEDAWCDGKKAFEAAVLASEAYRILGKTGLSQECYPSVNTPLLDGDIAYHVRSGTHGILNYDWQQYLVFLAKYFK